MGEGGRKLERFEPAPHLLASGTWARDLPFLVLSFCIFKKESRLENGRTYHQQQPSLPRTFSAKARSIQGKLGLLVTLPPMWAQRGALLRIFTEEWVEGGVAEGLKAHSRALWWQ